MTIRADSSDVARSLDQFRGCLLGGAVGDALGAAVEFQSLAEIRARFGSGGIHDYAPAYGRRGAITDDTQMTLFTAEGLIRADDRGRDRGIAHVPSMVHRAYLRWLATQGQSSTALTPSMLDGWLYAVPALRSRRAPGNTCLSALASGTLGTVREPINDSKGCGGIMRVAPVGLAASAAANASATAGPAGADPFTLGCDLAAITHGHPSGYLAAGFFADLIARIVRGEQLRDAVEAATATLREWPAHAECLEAVEAAVRLAESGPPSAENVERLGEGWVAEESLAIALYCALTATNFEEAVVLAVNHGGDSDSTGAIVGNILGSLWGTRVIPARWLDGLELRDEIEQVATDLFRHFGDPTASPDADAPDDRDRYPSR